MRRPSLCRKLQICAILLSLGLGLQAGEDRSDVVQPGAQPAADPLTLPGSRKPENPVLEVNEPGFKARVSSPEVPVVTEATGAEGPRVVRPAKPREFTVPQEEGASGAEHVEPAEPVPAAEAISPALAKAIAKERSGKKPKDMVPVYEEIAKAEPQCAAAHYRYGLALYRTGEFIKSLAAMEKAVELQPDNPKYQCDFGLVALQAGSVEKALAACHAAAMAVPSNARYQSAYGDCLLAAGKVYDSTPEGSARMQVFPALDAYTRAVNLEPHNAEYIHNLGVATLHANSPKRALEIFDEAVRLQPKHAPYYCSRGIAYERNRKPREAIDDFQRALALDKENAYAHFLLANAYSDPDDPTYLNTYEALLHAQKAVKLTEGRNAQFLMGMARALRVARNYDEAIAAARLAIALSPRVEYKQEMAEFERLKKP